MSRPITATKPRPRATKSGRGRSSATRKATRKTAPSKVKARRTIAGTTRPSGAAAKPIRGFRAYTVAMDFVNSLVNYERRPPRRRDNGALTLTRIRRLLKKLGNPESSFRSVHIAGSKGKGSTATMLAQMLSNNGLKVGLYTSPHIVDVRERITIDDEMISERDMTRMISKVAMQVDDDPASRPTYFEFLTAVAFQYFADQQVDVAVVETGLGGRFDATNVIKPEACAMTSISLDHMALLGNTVEKIAMEKAGVFKAGTPVVSAPQPDGVKKALKLAARDAGTPVYFAGEDIRFTYRFEASRTGGPQARICVTTPTSHYDHLLVPLVGKHQAINCGVALGVLDQLKNRGFKLDDELSMSGLANVRLQGRMEILCDKPRVLGDGAHNAASVEALMRAIGQNVPYDSMVLIFGCCEDKDIPGMLRQMKLGADKVIFTRIKSPRSADPDDLAAQFAEISGRMAQVAPSLADAMAIAEKAVTPEDLICITGSFYLVSEAKSLFANHPHRAMSTLVQTS